MKDLSHYDNIFFIGDIHGQMDALIYGIDNLVEKNDAVISVGDLCDRGAKNIECLSYFLHAEKAYAVRGNHEDMFIRGTLYNSRQDYHCHIANGGSWMLDYPLPFLKGLASAIQTEFPTRMTIKHGNKTFGVCHAECPTEDWNEFVNSDNGYLQQRSIWGRDKARGDDIVIKNIDYTIQGHTPAKHVRVKGNQHFIDTCGQAIGENDEYGLTFLQWNGKVFKNYKVVKILGKFEIMEESM